MFIRAIVAVAALFIAAGSRAADAPLQPTGKWVVHFDDTQCIAEREYGSKEHLHRLVLKQPALGEVMQIAVVSEQGPVAPEEVAGTIEFDKAPPVKVSILRYGASKEKLRFLSVNASIAELRAAASTTRLRIRASGVDEVFNNPDLQPVLNVMDTCVADLQVFWNVSNSDSKSPLATQARGNLQSLFKPDDYPGLAIQNEETGTVAIALLIDEGGRVADCSVTQTSGIAVLDAQACAVLRERGKFEPAMGADGKPAKGSLVGRITWNLKP